MTNKMSVSLGQHGMSLNHLVDLKLLASYNFGVRYISLRHFPRTTSQVSISQVATSQMCNFPRGKFQKVRLGPLRRRRLQWGGRALRLGQTWEVAVWEIAHLRSFHLGKYPREIDACKYAFGKVHNIIIFTPIWILIKILSFSPLITC